jgi:short-subunit dehydrogenase
VPASTLTKRTSNYLFVNSSKYVKAYTRKTVVVTSGGRELGKAMSLAFANARANIIIISCTQQPLSDTAAKIKAKGSKCLIIARDITDIVFTKRAIAKCVERFRSVNILINNASLARFSTLVANNLFKIWAVYELNVKDVVNIIHTALPVMFLHSKGIIFNIASNLGIIGIPYALAYSSLKSAVIKLSEVVS